MPLHPSRSKSNSASKGKSTGRTKRKPLVFAAKPGQKRQDRLSKNSLLGKLSSPVKGGSPRKRASPSKRKSPDKGGAASARENLTARLKRASTSRKVRYLRVMGHELALTQLIQPRQQALDEHDEDEMFDGLDDLTRWNSPTYQLRQDEIEGACDILNAASAHCQGGSIFVPDHYRALAALLRSPQVNWNMTYEAVTSSAPDNVSCPIQPSENSAEVYCIDCFE